MYNSFKIVEKNYKTFYFTKGNILFAIMIVTTIMLSYYNEKNIFLKYATGLSILTCTSYFITEYFRQEPFRGKFTGIITFNKTDLLINNRKIEIDQIKKIFLRTDDYEGMQRGINTTMIRKSNGTNNLLDLDLKDGEKIKHFFQIEYRNQVDELKPFIINLIKNKLMTIEKGIEVLKLDNDYVMENFTEELNKKELD